MRKIFVTLMASLLSCSAAFAFWPEAAESSFEVGVAYRWDELKWKTEADTLLLVDGGTPVPVEVSSELEWKNLRIWQIQARGKYVTCDNLYLRVYADYGWITHGSVTDKDFISGFTTSTFETTTFDDELVISSNADSDRGHVYDASIGLGYQFRMCDDSVALTPVLGYSWHGQHLRLEHGDQSYPTYTTFSGLDSIYHTRWNGPWVGLDLDYRFYCDWTFFASYEFHWAHYHAKGDWNLRTDIIGDFHHHAKNAYGNLIAAGVKWEVSECWTVGVTGQWQWWNANHGHDKVKILEDELGDVDLECYLTTPLKDIRWKSGYVSIDVGMIF